MSVTATPRTRSFASGRALSPVDHFIACVDRRIGVQLVGKEYLIDSRLKVIARTCGLDTVEALLVAIQRGDRRLEDISVEAMTTNETSFFRDQHPFAALAQHILPDMEKRNAGRLTIWNGACSSGQESYTLAMTISEHLPEASGPGRTRIVSTDVSPEMVARTASAKYSRFEINRGLPAELAVKYFDQAGRNWVAKPVLRSMVEARELNLLGPWTGVPRSDLVLLRNVLIYFTPEARQEILRRIRTEVLKPDGCLVLGASETTVGIDSGFESRRIGSSICFFPKGT